MPPVSLSFLVASFALGQATATPTIPERHVPASVMLELRILENQFDLALGRDCAPEKCASKGCVYRDHVVIDLPRATSLPGLPQNDGLGAVPPQEYLTLASCDFAHEKSVNPRDAQALAKRLEQRLSKGWMKVTVGHQLLEPISSTLAESPPPKPEVKPPEPVKEPTPPVAEEPKEWDSKLALRELWVALLPHFFWMVGLFLATLAAWALIWAGRRLGRETLEEKALAAQLANGGGETEPEEPVEPAAPTAPGPAVPSADDAFVADQRKLWQSRIDGAELGQDGGGLVQLLRDWLRAREFPLLAKAILLFGDRLSTALPSDGALAARKVEFAEYLKSLDEKVLPDDASFFRTLHHHTVSSALLAQSDAETYRSIGAEFGASGVISLMGVLGGRHGALLFAHLPVELQREVARSLPQPALLSVTGHLLDSNRMSSDERTYLFSAVDSARAGATIPPPPRGHAQDIPDRGLEFDAAGALSVLLPMVPSATRKQLLGERASGGVLPQWYDDVLFAEMFDALPSPEARSDLLLEIEIRPLAAWLSVQPAALRDDLLKTLSDTFQTAIKASSSFASRAEQSRLARVGQDELVAGLKRLYARGVTSFGALAG